MSNLKLLFNPRGIAIIGASQNIKAIGGQPIKHLQENGYKGRIYPVNSKYDELHGLRCYSTVLDLPDPVDLAIIAVKAQLVPGILNDCGKRGIRFAFIFSAGFSEFGEAGAKLQQEVVEVATQYGIQFVGPNCQGMMNITANVFAGFGDVFEARPFYPGSVSMVTQSGGFGYSVVNVAQELGLGFNTIISTGNEASITTEDIIDYYIEDPLTGIISAYVEGLKHPRRLLELGKKALEAGKPFLVWKVGKSEVGSKAAASHTGSLAGNRELYDAVFAQSGIIPIDDVYDLIDFANVYEQNKLPAGNRMGVVTISGGAGVAVSDKCYELGLEVPPVSETTRKKLSEVIPQFASAMNPIDVTAQIFNEPSLLRKAVEIIARDDNLDMIIILNANMHKDLGKKVAEEIAAIAKLTDKTIAVSWSARDHLNSEGFQILKENAVPVFKTPARGVKALYHLSCFSEAIRREAKQKTYPDISSEARKLVGQILAELHRIPTEYEARKIMSHYGIPIPEEMLANSADEAAAFAGRIGYPIVLKVMSPDLLHKTEAKAVKVGIRDEDELRQSYHQIIQNAHAYNASMRIDGVLVMPMVKDGVECIIGVNNDPQFGPAVMLGLGGIFTEVLKDVTFRLPPLSYEEAKEMLEDIKSSAVLKGVRGKEPADIDALVDVLVRVSAFAYDHKQEVGEIDINPIFVLPKGKGVVVGDALLVPAMATEKVQHK